MLSKKELKSLLFIDIETITEFEFFSEFEESRPELSKLFIDKMIKKNNLDSNYTPDDLQICYRNNASLYPEFSKIITISYGMVKIDDDSKGYNKIIKNITDTNEVNILARFANVLNKIYESNSNLKLCGHNIEGFDIPFLIKRYIINLLELPKILHIFNLKPWESPIVDTMKIWRFGSFEPTSLDILCNVLNIESPKSVEVNNKIISNIYYNDNENGLDIISEYCTKDVDVLIDILHRFLISHGTHY